MGTLIESQLVKNHTMLPGGARKEFRNELLFCYMFENERFSLKWGVGEFF
jgi:hypothetical protein